MIKKLRVTVDGKSYDVSVEVPDENGASAAPALPPISAPVPALVAPATPPPSAVTTTPSPAGNGADDVKSPLAGRIIAIAVQVGQAVKEGDNLLTVEAMKMNTSVNSPKAGTVAEILTTVGSAVDEGQALIRLS